MENFDEATKSRALRAAASFLATWIPYPAESNHEYSAVEVCDRLREINTDEDLTLEKNDMILAFDHWNDEMEDGSVKFADNVHRSRDDICTGVNRDRRIIASQSLREVL